MVATVTAIYGTGEYGNSEYNVLVGDYSDVFSLVDTDATVLTAVRILSEAYSLTDGDTKDFTRTLTEALSNSDTYAKVWTLARVYSEAIALTDELTKQSSLELSEAHELSDDLLLSIIKVLSEAYSLADTLEAIKIIERIFTESIVFTFTTATYGTGVYDQSKYDTLGSSTGDSILKENSRSLTEAIILNDTYERDWDPERTYSENIALSEDNLSSLIRTLSEIISLSATQLMTIAKPLTETITLSATRDLSLLKTFAESIALTDGDTIQFSTELSESFSTTDIYSKIWIAVNIYSESLGLSDDLKKETGKNLIEAIALSDTENLSLSRNLTESNSLVDDIETSWSIQRTFSEALSFTDNIYKSFSLDALTESLSLDDGNMPFQFIKLLSESFSIADRIIGTSYDGLALTMARNDIQGIITEQGIQGQIIRQTDTTASMGDSTGVSEERYDIYVSVQDITRKDRQIHDMGLAIPGNVKAFFFHEYDDDMTGNGTLKVQPGDILFDNEEKYWRVEQIIAERKMQSEEVFRSAVLKKIDLDL